MKLRSLIDHLKPPRGFRLSAAGKVFFIFLFGISLAGMLTGNNLLFLVLAVLLTFMIVSGIESEWNIRHLEVSRILPAEIHAGTPVRIGYLIGNKKNRSRRLVLRDFADIRITELAPGMPARVEADAVYAKRGRQQLGDIVVRTTFPYGLFEKSITFPARGEIIVFPQPLPVNPESLRGIEGDGSGPQKEAVSHIRPYVAGDPLAGIVWKRRHTGLFSRIMEGGTGHAGILILTPTGNLEDKISMAAWLISEFAGSGRPFGLCVNDYYSGLQKGRPHKRALLEKLALLETIREPDMRSVDEYSPIFRL